MVNIFILLIIYIIKVIKTKYPDNQTNPELVFETNLLNFHSENPDLLKRYNQKGKYFAFPNTIRINKYGKIFISVPRHIFDVSVSSSIPGTMNVLENNILYPWPNEKENNYLYGPIHSIVGFEIDLDGNVWMLNHKKQIHEILVYDVNGNFLKKYNLTLSTIHSKHESYLSNILLDLKDNYAFITDTGKIFQNSFDEKDKESNYTKTKSNIITVKLESGLSFKNLQKDPSLRPINHYENENAFSNKIDKIGLYGIALTCDKNFLYYYPIRSDKLYSIFAYKLKDERAIMKFSDIVEYNKKVSGFEMISSARGLLYYTAIEDNSILVHFHERLLSFNTIRSIGQNKKLYKDYDKEFPSSLTFNGTTGFLFYLVNSHNIFLDNNLHKPLNESEINFKIYKVMVNDRSYLYPCNVFSYMPNYIWGFIVVGSLSLSIFLIRLMKFIGTLDDKKNEEIINDESELQPLE